MLRLGVGVLVGLLSQNPAAAPLPGDAADAAVVRLVDSLLRTPSDRLNIGDAALTLSILRFPDANIQAGKELLDGIAGRVKGLVGSRTDPDLRIRAINTVLYREMGFSYDTDAMDALVRNERPELRTLWHLLRTRRGNCSSLPVLWYTIAERLHYPVFMVSAPQHLFLRYDDGAFRSNIEATSGGGEATDDQLVQDLGVPEEGIRSGAYLRELSRRELLAVLVGDAVAPRLSSDVETAIGGLEAAAVLAPRSVEIHWQLSAAYEIKAKQLGSLSFHERALSHAVAATKLGAAEPVKEGYWQGFMEKRATAAAAEILQPSLRAQSYDVVAWLARGGHVHREPVNAWGSPGARPRREPRFPRAGHEPNGSSCSANAAI